MPYIIFFQILIKKHHTDAVNQKKRKRTESPKEQPILNTKRPTKRINYEALDDTSFDDYLGGFDESLAPAQLSSHPNTDGITYSSQSTSQFNEQENIPSQTTSQPNGGCEPTSHTEIDWKEEIIQEMLAQKLAPVGIMKIINKFILVKKFIREIDLTSFFGFDFFKFS